MAVEWSVNFELEKIKPNTEQFSRNGSNRYDFKV